MLLMDPVLLYSCSYIYFGQAKNVASFCAGDLKLCTVCEALLNTRSMPTYRCTGSDHEAAGPKTSTKRV
jgi:hypothetical protein